jgi:hypothetical protein
MENWKKNNQFYNLGISSLFFGYEFIRILYLHNIEE